MENPNNNPFVSLNGDKAETLKAVYRECMEAVQEARETLGKNCPNGRNYQHDACDYPAARKEHIVFMKQLEIMEERFTEIWLAVDDQS